MTAPPQGNARRDDFQGGATELALCALGAVEDELGRFVDVLVAAEMSLPALLVCRQPAGFALGAAGDDRDLVGAHLNP
jgi:hypothetical protein